MSAALPAAWPPSLQLLLGPAADEMWAAVLTPRSGRLRGLRASTVSLRADGSATVRYTAEVGWAGGRTTRESLAAVTGSRIPPGAAVVEGGRGDGDGDPVRVGLWRWPDDPALPGLSWAASAARTAERLATLGVAAGPVRLRLRAYRPGRRAVVEVTGTTGRWFLKVVRPAHASALAARHAALAPAVPVPPVLAATDDGVLVLPALEGTPMRTALRGDPAALPPPEDLAALLDALPAGRGDEGAAADPAARARSYATVVELTRPELGPRLARLADAVAAAVRPQPVVGVHGDFYEAQLLVDGGRVVGLLDVDTAGPGARIDDWATLLGHLALLEHLSATPAPVSAYRMRVEEHLAGRWPAGELRMRIAGVLVGLATGPFRVQQAGWAEATDARVRLAEEWAGLAEPGPALP